MKELWKRRGMRAFTGLIALAVALVALMGCAALAEGVVSTNVVMRVSRLTQDAVVDEGEDLSMEINMDGVTPTSYQWYYNDAPISGATQKVYNIVNATEADSGLYRMDAFDADGRMLVSYDMAVRVRGKDMPKSGDTSLPVEAVIFAMLAAGGMLALHIRRAAKRV